MAAAPLTAQPEMPAARPTRSLASTPGTPFEPPMRFAPDFLWGVATSAYQVEGAASADGKGESIWDHFCQQPGAIADGSSGRIACDHYHRLEQDLDLLATLGVQAYRFSVSWPRVQPLGQGAWNPGGLAFYGRLVDGLQARGIRAHCTLNHWDLPQALQDQGGWANRGTVQHFVDYALGMHQYFGPRVAAITTHNEPWVVAVLGHEQGVFAPGLRSRALASQVAHHLLLSHGLALRALRQAGCRAQLGLVLNLAPVLPATRTLADMALARLEDGRLLRWYMDALLHGRYPQDVLDALGADAPQVEPGDLDTIRTPLDFLGVNYYPRVVVGAGGPFDVHASGLPITDTGWEVWPEGLVELLLRLHRDYTLPPLYITENGAAFADTVVATPQGLRVHDQARTDYIASHISAIGTALAQGVPVAGYMVWSLLDNFAWASGLSKRFGIVHVDYGTQARTAKDSARWYRGFLQRQRSQPPPPAGHLHPDDAAARRQQTDNAWTL